MRLRVPLAMIVLVLAACAAWWFLARGKPAAAGGDQDAPVMVSDMVVAPRSWRDRMEAFGTLRAVRGAELSAQVPGIVDSIAFESGQTVKAGAVLIRLRLYDDTAKLAQLQAMVSLWQANVSRDQKQFAVQAISHATLDLDDANLRQFQAQADAQRQLIEQKIVRAPFDGTLGIRQVDLGQYLPAGTAVTTLQALDPIYLDFNVVQQRLADIHVGQTVQVSVDSSPGRLFQATVQAIDSRIDQQSRMASVRAVLDNKDHALLPGMFAVAHVDVGGTRPVIALPQGAISFNPYGDFVYVLAPRPGHGGSFVATSRVVRPGRTEGDLVVVEDGLKPGETIVTAGQFKLRSGQTVSIDNSVQPAASPAPNPAEE